MKIHHLNCGSFSSPFTSIRGITYALLVETNAGLVLIDTGFGIGDCTHPTPFMRGFTSLLGAALDIEETAAQQVKRLGYDVAEVQHIVLTHLHLDHTGGLPDFPAAQVHVSRMEYETLQHPRGLLERGHVAAHWAHKPHWVLHEVKGENWYGFDATPVIAGLVPEILLVALPGHTRGHCGVAVQTPDGWLLQCGDAVSTYHPEVDLRPAKRENYPLGFLPKAIAEYFTGTQVHRLRELARNHPEVQIISSHDMRKYAKYQQR